MKLEELLRHVADNVEAGREVGAGLLYCGDKSTARNASKLCWHNPSKYTLAPRTRTVNGFDVPLPETEPLSDLQIYHYVELSVKEYYGRRVWCNDCFDQTRLERGLVFLTPESAEANGKALLGVDPYAEAEK